MQRGSCWDLLEDRLRLRRSPGASANRSDNQTDGPMQSEWMIGPASTTVGAASLPAMQPPLNVAHDLRSLEVRPMRIEKPAQCLQRGLLRVLDPSLARQRLKLLVQLVGAFHGDGLHRANHTDGRQRAQGSDAPIITDTSMVSAWLGYWQSLLSSMRIDLPGSLQTVNTSPAYFLGVPSRMKSRSAWSKRLAGS